MGDGEIFRHRDTVDRYCHDELYVAEVDERFPDLGLHIGCHSPDASITVQVREPFVDVLLDALLAWKARHRGGAEDPERVINE